VQRDDGSGRIERLPAQIQSLRCPSKFHTIPWAILRLDDGRLVLFASSEKASRVPERYFMSHPTVVLAFSEDTRGNTWGAFQETKIPCRPSQVTYLGGGKLFFADTSRDKLYFTDDCGRTWDAKSFPRIKNGNPYYGEGNTWVDRDGTGKATRVLTLGWNYEPGRDKWPSSDAFVYLRESFDGGHTWPTERTFPQWKFSSPYQGKTYVRGVSEGSIVRAKNGWLVAALRTDMFPKYLVDPDTHTDNLEGVAISVSKDDGESWSQMSLISEGGRMHANLQRLPSGDLVCSMICRIDIEGQGRLSPTAERPIHPEDWDHSTRHPFGNRKGADAVVSRDNGLTWTEWYHLDSFETFLPNVVTTCGHIAAVALDDGSMITAYGKYPTGETVLVRWHPDAKPLTPNAKVPDSDPFIMQGGRFQLRDKR